jgi:hypothetical protein
MLSAFMQLIVSFRDLAGPLKLSLPKLCSITTVPGILKEFFHDAPDVLDPEVNAENVQS